ncbi:LPS export ABC transporter periplasmic protein LptC [Moraxella nasovis]|uniref:LPS export ABC transporter periplasmic protein LptC n=1 Tax=Moraxella nasovis TaxID=2904121 RepID=UPI001F608652|nr:LPS export ABC transporter periplasmic protein LptC [Moraxella nasovis]UNU73139.1 LPS export ABC transporter periplasmic protein LptC [Moraxella nasovis]
MKMRFLFILGAVILALATWFFYQEDVEVKPALPSTPDVTSEVSQIQAIQTNPKTGKVEYTLTAQSLVQNADGKDMMADVVMDWQPSDLAHYGLTAKRATLDQTTGDLYLIGGFTLTKDATDTAPKMVIQGDKMVGNTKSRTVQSDQPITVEQGFDSFKAQGFTADLDTGEYQFHHIEMWYQPAGR